MYFDLYDDRPDYEALTREYARLEGLLHLIVAVLVAFFMDIVAVIMLFYMASLPPSDAAKRAAMIAAQRDTSPPRFVFMAPAFDRRSKTVAPNAPASDMDRRAASPQRSPHPTNDLPFSRGNTPDMVEQRGMVAPPEVLRNQQNQAAAERPGQNGDNGQNASPLAGMTGPPLATTPQGNSGAPGAPGPLASAVANPFRYAPPNVFDNPGGAGGEPQAAIQFDSKGVEFGPWLRRFIAQIKRNWLIPMAAMTMKGHVVVTFNVHKDGSITDIEVAGPCPVESFNRAAQGALISSNPTQPLPPEYPAERCFFTVTFYYNETPPYR